jgi:hypothetical protein
MLAVVVVARAVGLLVVASRAVRGLKRHLLDTLALVLAVLRITLMSEARVGRPQWVHSITMAPSLEAVALVSSK